MVVFTVGVAAPVGLRMTTFILGITCHLHAALKHRALPISTSDAQSCLFSYLKLYLIPFLGFPLPMHAHHMESFTWRYQVFDKTHSFASNLIEREDLVLHFNNVLN